MFRPGHRPTHVSGFARAAAALLLFSAWMGLLFSGFLFHGALHLLLLGAAALFPWRSLPAAARSADDPPEIDSPGD